MANRLSKASSPYLLQHANNPVDWFPWGEEALEKARKENKLIHISSIMCNNIGIPLRYLGQYIFFKGLS